MRSIKIIKLFPIVQFFIQIYIIRDNWAYGGGGISVIDFPDWSDETPNIINNTIVDNFSDDHGGGICFALGQGNVVNNIIYFNETGGVGSQVNIGGNNNSQFHFNDIHGGKEAFSYIGLSEVAHYENNLEEDPMFIWYPYDLQLDGRYADNHSPCIAAGTANIEINGNMIQAPEKDFKDDPRVNSPNGNTDMGAYEYPWFVNIKEESLHSFDWVVSPNPASDKVQFSFKLKDSANVLVEAYEMTGKKAAVVLDTKLSQGPHEFNWNTNILDPGLYFITLKINNDLITTKLMVSKE